MLLFFLILILIYILILIIKWNVDKNRIKIINKSKFKITNNIIILNFDSYDACHDYFDSIFNSNQTIISYHRTFKNLDKLYHILDKFEYSNKYFVQKLIPKIDLIKYDNCYFLNTEQLTDIKHLNYIKKINKNIKLLDYSYQNVNILKKKNISSQYLPYQIYYPEIFNFKKIFDVAIIGLDLFNDNSSRRFLIYNDLKKKGVKINNIIGFYENRDKQLFKHKIILNIHHNDNYKIYEELRCTRCTFNNMIVITEESENLSEYMYYDKIIEVKYNDIVNKTLEVLNNYEKYKSDLFEK